MTNATECPRGSYRPTKGGASVGDCYPCLAGHYCAETGLSEPSGQCFQGFYCPEDEYTIDPMPTGFECPEGFYCPNGTGSPLACLPGKLGRVIFSFYFRLI